MKRTDDSPLLKQDGIAILFVMTAITILTAILADFTYETQINKLRSYNSQDRIQAKLNAEAGLKLALARLELYQVARNELEKNTSLKDTIKVGDLNTIWSIPFVYPILVPPRTPPAVKTAIDEFMKEALLQGEMSTSIKNISNKININLLRIGDPKVIAQNNSTGSEESGGSQSEQSSSKSDPVKTIQNLEKQLVELFRQSFDQKIENDDTFSQKYSNIEPEILFKEIKFFINDRDRELEPEVQEIRSQYEAKGIRGKHAPFQSKSELYLLEGWPDELLDLIINELTVHGVVAIDLNTITDKGLRLLIPEIDEQQIKDFFEYRDDPKAPRPFNNVREFRDYVSNTAGILDSGEMDKRIKDFQDAGIEFGVYGSLFEIESKGISGRSEYTITAVIEIPVKPTAPPQNQKKEGEDGSESGSSEGEGEGEGEGESTQTTERKNQEKKPDPLQFLKPRVVEITIS